MKLADALRPLTDPVEVQATATRVLGEHLRLSRVHYGETTDDGFVVVERDYTDGVIGIRGRFRMDGFGPGHIARLREGQTLVVPDVAHCAELAEAERGAYAGVSVGAMVGVPLVKGGRLTAVLAIHQSTVREWTPEEVALIENVAERTWAAVEQARAESALRASEERQAFLLKLSDALRPLKDPTEVQGEACRMLGEHLGANRVSYADVEGDECIIHRGYVNGVAPMVGRVPLMAYGEPVLTAFRRGETVAVADVDAEPMFTAGERAQFKASEIASFVGVMLVKGGRTVGAFGAHSAAPRAWAPSEVELIREVGERIWAAAERARAEFALRESERGRLMALAGGRMGTWRCDTKTRSVSGDGAFMAMFNLPPARDALSVERLQEKMAPGDAAKFDALMRTDFAPGAGIEDTLRLDRVAAAPVWLAWRGQADAENPALLVGVCFDVTARMKAEEALLESELRFELALTAARMGVWTLNIDTGVQVRDSNLNQLLGLAPVESTQPFTEFLGRIYVYDRAAVRAAFDASAHGGRSLSAEFRVVWPDGAVRWLRDQGDVFGDARAGTRRMTGVCVDVTDLKDAEEALRRAHVELETRVAERTTELASAFESLGSEMARRLDLTRRLATAQEDERRRVARDLHDSVGQLLAGLSLAVKAVETAGELPRASAARLTEVQRMADALGREIHGLAVRLRPTSLDDIGLEPALEQLVAEWSSRSGVRADFHSTGAGLRRLPPDIETALYRVVQEALTNVARHARATTVSVVVGRPDGHVTAVIEDDGAGFDTETGPKGRLGLLGMRERVTLVGGTMEVESAPGQGSTIIARIPLSD